MAVQIAEIIIAAREMIPDIAGLAVIPVPANVTYTAVAATGSTLGAGTYFLRTTFFAAYGESVATTEQSVVVAAGQGIQVSGPVPGTGTKLRTYFGIGTGNEFNYQESSTVPYTILAALGGGVPPTRSTLFVADSDGSIFSASSMFRWMNEALDIASRLVGGLLDYSGVPSVSGQSLYMVTGEWLKVTDVWYDGYGLGLEARGIYFRRNPVTSSVLRSATVSIRNNQVALEVWPQPARTAAATTLNLAMAATDTSAVLASAAGFLKTAPPGFALIGTEIVGYNAISGSTLLGLLRGLGGTVAQAQTAGMAVQELNLFFSGLREFSARYTPGTSATTLLIPSGWVNLLSLYMLSKARLSEQQPQEAQSLRQQFEAGLLAWARANRQIAGPVQVRIRGEGLDTVPGYGSVFGGVILR